MSPGKKSHHWRIPVYGELDYDFKQEEIYESRLDVSNPVGGVVYHRVIIAIARKLRGISANNGRGDDREHDERFEPFRGDYISRHPALYLFHSRIRSTKLIFLLVIHDARKQVQNGHDFVVLVQ